MAYYSSGNQAVDEMMKMNITGNITPPEWYRTITRENGKPHLLAILLLSDIVYWYRPVEVRDERTGHIIGIRKRFKGDLLQKNYEQYANFFGESKRTIKNAFDYLIRLRVIGREFREITLPNDMKINNVMYISLDTSRLFELTFPEEVMSASGLIDRKPGDNEEDIAETEDPEGGIAKESTPSCKILQEGVQKNVPPSAKDCKTLLKKNAGPHAPDCRTNTETTSETTDGDYPIHLSRISKEDRVRLADRRSGSDQMDKIPTKAEQYRKLIYENTHLEWHLENDPVGEREEYENLVELICDVVCAEHSRPIYINSTAMEPAIVRSRFLKLTDSHLQYVMECLQNNPNEKGIESYRNYKLTCLYNAPVTMGTYYQQKVNHDMGSGIWVKEDDG